jgi:hypothetical protein
MFQFPPEQRRLLLCYTAWVVWCISYLGHCGKRCERVVDAVSWDICIQDFPASAQHVEDIPDDFVPRLLGARSEIIARILAVAPMADFTDSAWGFSEGSDFSIEINLGNAETIGSMMLIVRGGDAAVGYVRDIIEHLGYRAIHTASGAFFKPEDALASLRTWRAYRDRVTGSHPRHQ